MPEKNNLLNCLNDTVGFQNNIYFYTQMTFISYLKENIYL